MSHVRRTVLPSPVVSLACSRESSGPSWSPAAAGRGSAGRSSTSARRPAGARLVAAAAARAASDGVVVVVPAARRSPRRAASPVAPRAANRCAPGWPHVPERGHDRVRARRRPPVRRRRRCSRRVIGAVADGADGAIPGVPVTDTIKQVDADGVVVRHPAARRADGRADPAGVPGRRAARRPRHGRRGHRRRRAGRGRWRTGGRGARRR